MGSFHKRFLFVLLIFFSACTYLKKHSKKVESEVVENEETFVDESKPYLSPSGYKPAEKQIAFSKDSGIETEQVDYENSLKRKIEELGKKIEELNNLYQESEQALNIMKTGQQQYKQKAERLEEKLLLFTRRTRELDEKFSEHINLRLSKEALEENMIYEKAQRLYLSGNYVDAVIMFKKYVSSFPHSTMADNAQYWLGEGYYSQGDYRRALEEFGKVADFPDKSKEPDAHLRKGYCYLRLKKYAEAREIFTHIIDKYSASQTEYAIVDSAERKLKEIRGKK
jgi:tol-pal system protein YbgF